MRTMNETKGNCKTENIKENRLKDDKEEFIRRIINDHKRNCKTENINENTLLLLTLLGASITETRTIDKKRNFDNKGIDEKRIKEKKHFGIITKIYKKIRG